MALVVKNPPVAAGDIRDLGSVPGLGRSPEGGHGNPLQYFCLENPIDRGAWWVKVNFHLVQLLSHVWLFETLWTPACQASLSITNSWSLLKLTSTSSKASILQHSTFSRVLLSHPYMTTGKTIALTRWTLFGKIMSLFSICYLCWS